MKALVRTSSLLIIIFLVLAGTLPASRAQEPSTLKIPFPRYDGSLTPYTFELGYPLVTLIYDTLMWRDEDGVPEPLLARSVIPNDRFDSYTIHIEPEVEWHDGAPVTAGDVAFTFGYLQAREHPRFTPQLRAIRSVEVVDHDTLVVDLEYPSEGFLDQPLADVPILPAHLWGGLTAEGVPRGLPVGSGPYLLESESLDDGYVFTANDRYFKGAPAPQKIKVPIISDYGDQLTALDDADVDALPVTLVGGDAGGAADLSVEISRGPLFAGTVLMFNTREPPFDKRPARAAVAAALDLDRIAGSVGGVVSAEQGYIHPSSRWASDQPLQRFNPERAIDRFARADLGILEVLAPENDEARREAGRQVVLALERVGLDAELRVLTAIELAAAVGQDRDGANFQMAIWNSPALASYDPDLLSVLFGSGPEQSLNLSGYNSARFDKESTRMERAIGDDRERAAERVLKVLAKEAPVVPLFFFEGAFAYRRAAFDDWVFVEGSGILDKRSFLGEPSEEDPKGEPDLAEGTETETTGIGPIGFVALLLVAVAVGLLIRGARRG